MVINEKLRCFISRYKSWLFLILQYCNGIKEMLQSRLPYQTAWPCY